MFQSPCFIYIMDNLTLIKDSFKLWYNNAFSTNVEVVINYSDEQRLSIKAIHTAKMELCVVGIKEGMSYILPIESLQENYNHGIKSEEEEKEHMTLRFLSKLYSYRK